MKKRPTESSKSLSVMVRNREGGREIAAKAPSGRTRFSGALRVRTVVVNQDITKIKVVPKLSCIIQHTIDSQKYS